MKDKPRPKRKKIEIKQLIRVKVDLFGLTEEDIRYLIEHAKEIKDHAEWERTSA